MVTSLQGKGCMGVTTMRIEKEIIFEFKIPHNNQLLGEDEGKSKCLLIYAEFLLGIW